MIQKYTIPSLVVAVGVLLLASCGQEGDAKPDAPAVAFGDDFEFIRLEAEKAEKIEGDIIRIVVDDGASGGKCLEIPDKAGTPDAKPPSPQKFATARYRFTVKKPGNYTFWCRRKWFDSCGDTLAVRFDRPGEARKLDDTEYLFGGSDNKGKRWAWSPVYVKGKGKPRQFFLDAGEHVLEILNREDGPRFDVILLTNDRDYVPVGMEED
ncbi:hypothetical protein HQ576_14795 [bacterium]|nr:hypothetical protein [bacterium]